MTTTNLKRYEELQQEVAELSREIKELELKRNKLRLERNRLKNQINEPRFGSTSGGDALVVPRLLLGDVLAEWFKRQSEKEGLQKRLSLMSGVSARTIRAIMNVDGTDKKARKFITLKVADKLLVATDMEYEILPGGKIPVVPNPQYKSEPCNED